MPKPLFTDLNPATGGGFDAVEIGLVRDVTGYDTPVGVVVGGPFVATVAIQVSMDNVIWATFGAALTAPGTVKIDIPVKFVRANCTAFTSGLAVVLLGALNTTTEDQV